MRALRVAVGVVILIYALAGGALGATMAALRFGLVDPPAAATRAQIDLMEGTSWPLIVLWLIAMALHLVVAIKLIRRVKTFVFWAAAFLTGVVSWLWFRAEGYYEPAIPPGLLYADYAVLLTSLVFGVCIWLLGRTHLD